MFFDRHAAGISLAEKLAQFKNKNAVLYALPRGGVPVGFEVSKKLGLPLDLLIVQKIGHPMNRDYGICSISENGDRICDECGLCGLDETWLDYEAELKLLEAARRRAIYKRGEPSVSAENKIAILIDDGIATGLTMKAAVQAIQAQWPEQIVIATPVAPHDVVRELKSGVDSIVVVDDDREYQGTVSAYYTHFSEISDREVISLLAKANQNFVKSLPQMPHARMRMTR